MYKIMKIYYDKLTGELIWTVAYNHDAAVDFDHDYAVSTTLQERTKDSIGLLILRNGAYARDFMEGRLAGVWLNTLLPRFEYPNPEEPGEPVAPAVPLSTELAAVRAELETARAELLATNTMLLEFMEATLLA